MYRLRIYFWRIVLFLVDTSIHYFPDRRKSRTDLKSGNVVLTGTVYSENWLRAHILPLQHARHISDVILVLPDDSISLPGVEIFSPSERHVRWLGHTAARMLLFAKVVMSTRPEFVGGFHLIFNGIFSILLAKIAGATSIYFCVGGVTELLESGRTENKAFRFLQNKDDILTGRLLSIARRADLVITMGNSAREYFVGRGFAPIGTRVIPGAVDSKLFDVEVRDPEFDIVLVARLTAVKQVWLLVDVVSALVQRGIEIQCVVVGDGPDRAELEDYSNTQGVAENISFVGHSSSVSDYLNKSRLFLLTSRSEGLALSLLEALTCGVPAIVPDVGDLKDALAHGENGFLVQNHNVAEYCQYVELLLTEESMRRSFSECARRAVQGFTLERTAMLWDEAISEMSDRVR